MSSSYIPRTYEYKMSRECAKDILSTRKGEAKKTSNAKYLCDYVNNEMGLNRPVSKVIFF